jgi:hypothetical protein
MKEKKTTRTRVVSFKLLQEEYAKLETTWKKTTIKKLSEYLRRLIFNKPVTNCVRNQSLDDFMAEMVLLRKELNAIGVNFDQAVQRLDTIDNPPQMQGWLHDFRRDKNGLFGKIEEIRLKINLISDEWLR